MNTGARGRPLRLSGRPRRSAVRHPASAFLLLAIAIVVGGLVVFITGLSTHAAGISRVAGIVVLMLSPTLLIGTALYAPRGVRAVWRGLIGRRAGKTPQPTNPPIEQLAGDRRRLRALEATITERATQGAVPSGPPSQYRGARCRRPAGAETPLRQRCAPRSCRPTPRRSTA
jgi:membrane protein implicated in regulation of membrane protease activity